ncbi:glycoside hydrolase family 16 protein [Babjeviella inositovora NRRL Y-12698]|uniref:Glycoside hydrolase family 16 protein n=1 Tax=Babjeviella inositovora NRRL Y-12698 TaxID=984486 RepID=A0A1E3QUE1_9ASCO|nr:glycoside hydrolase family 16 protein [Babjeviella inositovora NRRL Y-12698]ODQ80537.1 glycoside hydrolase family 16 protein [Babjeviella inositovora NRRL Y-12698]
MSLPTHDKSKAQVHCHGLDSNTSYLPPVTSHFTMVPKSSEANEIETTTTLVSPKTTLTSEVERKTGLNVSQLEIEGPLEIELDNIPSSTFKLVGSYGNFQQHIRSEPAPHVPYTDGRYLVMEKRGQPPAVLPIKYNNHRFYVSGAYDYSEDFYTHPRLLEVLEERFRKEYSRKKATHQRQQNFWNRFSFLPESWRILEPYMEETPPQDLVAHYRKISGMRRLLGRRPPPLEDTSNCSSLKSETIVHVVSPTPVLTPLSVAQHPGIHPSNLLAKGEDPMSYFSKPRVFVRWYDYLNLRKLYHNCNYRKLSVILALLAFFSIVPLSFYATGMKARGLAKNYRVEKQTVLSDYVYPQLSAIRTRLVDPDTPMEYHTKAGKDGKPLKLVFSDEFNKEGRTFYPNDDQFFEAVDIHYAATNDLEWYTPEMVTTSNGSLKIRLDYRDDIHGFLFASAMLQSWNKLCFQEGLLEVSVKLPGYSNAGGLWPGVWTLGNLARAGYTASTEGAWPYSYEACDAGITPSQSSEDGMSQLPGQKLASCVCPQEDHPNHGIGRGAPEIDLLEANKIRGNKLFSVSQTLQVAPFDIWYLPDYDFIEMYNPNLTSMNNYVGTPYQEAISILTSLNETWFEHVRDLSTPDVILPNETHFQTYAMEYESKGRPEDAFVAFRVGDVPSATIKGSALHPEGNIDWRYISKEPMSIIMNLGLSYSWNYIDWPSLRFPATLEIDYIRLYQQESHISLTCDPEGHPTTEYIDQHLNAYMDANLTSWLAAGYTFPKTSLDGRCK